MMTSEEKILLLLKKRGFLTTKVVVESLGVSREYAHRLLVRLKDEGRLLLIGKTNRAKYVSSENTEAVTAARKSIASASYRLKNVDLKEDQVFNRLLNETGIFIDVSDNVRKLVRYGFTEMLNNAIDHSESERIEVECRRSTTAITFSVRDFGIGAFNNIRNTFRLPGTLEAIQELLKGKRTTDSARHSGQGIFFSSKMADVFVLDSYEKTLTVNNLIRDVFITDRRLLKGTRVSFSVQLASPRTTKEVFDAYVAADDDDAEFSKTRVTVKLYRYGRDLPSRSEAKRIMLNLENFREIELDFTDVETVGQAFADEIFRVWQNEHDKIRIIAINANENAVFMIKRAGGTIGQDRLAI